MLERRKKRSDERHQALAWLLEACRERCDARAVVLADARGLLMASTALPDDAAAELAARAPEPSRRGSLDVATVLADDAPVFVAIDRAQRDLGPVLEAAAGVRRLLATSSAIA